MATPRRGPGSTGRRVATAVTALLVMIGLVAACAPAPPGDFYDAPDPLPFGKPGKLIWAEPMAAAGPGLASARTAGPCPRRRGRRTRPASRRPVARWSGS